MSEGYDHLYIVQKSLVNIGGDNGVYKVLFQCGNWCYSGNIKLNEENLVISKLTEIITNIQKQQSSLRFYCDTKNLKNELEFAVQVRFIAKSYDIFNQYITSTQVEGRFVELLETNDWLDIQNGCFFELRCNYIPQEVSDSILIIRKSYNKGLITTIAYYDDSTYVVLQPGEGDFPLLDIRYPIFASTGDNTVLLVTDDFEQGSFFDGLFVWKAFKNGPTDSNHNIKKQCVLETADLSTGTSENLYIILKERNHSNASTHRDILLRFGNWCYSGRLLITDSEISKADDAVEILRAQQSCMRFIFEASKVPAGSPFSAALEYMHKTVLPNIKLVLARSEVHIQQLLNRLVVQGEEATSHWLDSNSVFEFEVEDSLLPFDLKETELIVATDFDASGICFLVVMRKNIVCVVVNEHQSGITGLPLLDIVIPRMNKKGDGYVLETYTNGIANWPGLRELSIWQSVGYQQECEFASQEKSILKTPHNATNLCKVGASVVQSKGQDDTDSRDCDSRLHFVKECEVKETSPIRTSSIKLARPHHLPALATEIKTSAVWDRDGRPLRKL